MTRRIMQVNTLIRHEISELLQRQVKDPRLGTFIAITEVSTSPDLRHAKIFVSSICSEAEKAETMAALASASGFLRRELRGRLRLRRIPELFFEWDNSIEQGAHIQELIDRVTID